MTTAPRPQIECEQQQVSVFVPDLDAAIAFYTEQLGFTLAFKWGDPPHFAGVNLDRTQIFLDGRSAPTGPPIEIQRVDVPVRLEKRLAALLVDLAAHKRMSIDSCLEEMLLHTNDGVGPHTKGTVRYIQQLKRKHGIDYDSHGSCRFVEE